ncbi:MAG: DUF401 family protein [Bacillota bacterium]
MILVTLILSMAVILFLVSKKVNIGYSLIIGSVLLALLNGRGLLYTFKILASSLLEPTTVTLSLTIALITILGHLMEVYLIMDRMITALEKILRSAKFTILMAPAIIGTLLVTGGALMSCPVVESLGNRLHLEKDKKAAINLIFRHALYFIFPLSTTILLAAEIGDFNVWDFVKLQFPIAVVMYIAGYVLYLRHSHEPRLEKIQPREYLDAIGAFLLYSSPILVSLLGVVLLKLPFHVSLFFGILCSILIHLYDEKKDPQYHVEQGIIKTIIKGIKPPMIIAVIGVMIFKNVMNDFQEIYTQLGALLNEGIPLEIIMFAACAFISFSLASTQPSIAIMFPMILPLAPNYDVKLLYAMFIYTSGFVFYYISPMHLCQVLTLEYFEVNLKDLYKNYIIILPIIYVTMLIIYGLHMM